MDRRRLLLILAVFVAVIGTALVFLYVKGADKRANNQYDNVSVLKATANIAAGETYDSALVRGEDVAASRSRKNQLIEGYQTTTTALKGKIVVRPDLRRPADHRRASGATAATSPRPPTCRSPRA